MLERRKQILPDKRICSPPQLEKLRENGGKKFLADREFKYLAILSKWEFSD